MCICTAMVAEMPDEERNISAVSMQMNVLPTRMANAFA